MANDGDYPFVVNVRNTFQEIMLKVEYNFIPRVNEVHTTAEACEKPAKKPVDKEPIKRTYSIPPGTTFCFSLYWEKDSLVLSPDKMTGNCHIWCGPEALARLYSPDVTLTGRIAEETEKNINPTITPDPKPINRGNGKESRKFHKGAAWVLNQRAPWILEIRKLLPDPADVNVTLGDDPPGS